MKKLFLKLTTLLLLLFVGVGQMWADWYFTGSMNSWPEYPSGDAYKFTGSPLQCTLHLQAQQYEFKITSGGWANAHGANGQQPNMSLDQDFSVNQSGNKGANIKFTPSEEGDYLFTLTPSGNPWNLRVTKVVVRPTYYVAGNGDNHPGWLNGQNWQCSAASNLMDYDEESGVWTKTYTNVTHKNDFEFKLCKNGTWDTPVGYSSADELCSNVASFTDAGGNDHNIGFATEVDGDITITFDGEKVCVTIPTPTPSAPSVVEDTPGSLTWMATSSSPIVLGNGTQANPFVVPLEANLHLVAGGIRVVNPDANFTLQNIFDINVDRLWDQNRTLDIWCVNNSDPSVHGTGLSPVVYYKATENCFLNIYNGPATSETQMAGGYVSETNHNTYTLTKVLEAGTYKFNFRDPALNATLYNWNSVADAKRFGNVTLTKTAEFDDFQFTLSKKMSVTFTFDIDRMTVSDKSITVNATPYLEDPAELHVQSNAFGPWTIESEAMAVNEGIYTYTLRNVPARQNPAEFNFWNKVDGNYSEWAHFEDAVSVTGASDMNNNFQVPNTELCDIVITATYANHTLSSVVVVQQPLTTGWYLNGDSPMTWDKSASMEFIKAQGTATSGSVTVSLSANTKYAIQLRDNSDGQWTNDNKGTLTRANCTDWPFATAGGYQKNSYIQTDVEGDYTFTYNISDKTLSVTYPALPTYTVTIAKNEAEWGTTKVNGEEVTEVANVEYNTTIGASNEYLRIGSATTVVAAPAAAGDYFYAFSAWTGIPDGGKVTDDVIVTANFTRVPRLAITFNANGGGGSMEQLILTAAGALTSNTFTTPAYNKYFAGWADTKAKADAGTVDYANGAQITPAEALKGNLTLYAVWLTYNPVASISGDYSNIVAGSDQAVTFTPNTTDCTWPANMTYVWQMFDSEGTELSTSDDYFTIEDGQETAVLPAATVASLPEGTYTIKLSVYAGDQCETNQLGETKTCTLTVAADPKPTFTVDEDAVYYIYHNQDFDLSSLVVNATSLTSSCDGESANTIVAPYFDKNTLSSADRKYVDPIDAENNHFQTANMGQYYVTLTATNASGSATRHIKVRVYRYFIKHPWRTCDTEGTAYNMSWIWRGMDRTVDSETGDVSYTFAYVTGASIMVNMAYDWRYDWDNVFQTTGSSQGTFAPNSEWVDGNAVANKNDGCTVVDISKAISGSIAGECGQHVLEFALSQPEGNAPDLSHVARDFQTPKDVTVDATITMTMGTVGGGHIEGMGGWITTETAIKMLPGTPIEALAVPTNDTYDFEGWYHDAACTQKITATSGNEFVNGRVYYNMGIEANTTVYAKFTHVMAVYGSLDTGEGGDDWNTYPMTCISEGRYQTKIRLTKTPHVTNGYQFKIKHGTATNILANGGTMSRSNCSTWTYGNTGANTILTFDFPGDYIFTWDSTGVQSGTLSVTYPTGQALHVVEPTISENDYVFETDMSATATLEKGHTYYFKIKDWNSGKGIKWFGINDKGSDNPITHSIYGWTMYDGHADVYLRATEDGEYKFEMSWDANWNIVLNVVYPSAQIGYDVTGVLNGTHSLISVGMPLAWNQPVYNLYDAEGNVLYSAQTTQTINIGGENYLMGIIPVANEHLEGGASQVTFKHGHYAGLDLSHTVAADGVYIVRRQMDEPLPTGLTELTSAESGGNTNALYLYTRSTTPTEHTIYSRLSKQVTTAGTTISVSSAKYTFGTSILNREMDKVRYYVQTEDGWTPITLTSNILNLTNQTDFNVQRGCKFVTCASDGSIIKVIESMPFDIVDIAMTDDNNGTYCYTTYFNSKDKTVVPEGLKAFTIAYNEEENTLYRSHTFVAGDVIPAGTAVVFQGNYSFMSSKQDEEDALSAGNRILTRVAEGDGTPYQSALYGTDNSGLQVGQLTSAAQYFKFSRNSQGASGTLGWYWGAADGAGNFAATPHKAYLALPSSQAPLRIVMSEIVATQQLPTALEQNGVNGERALKQLRDGRVVILRAGRIYDLNGRLIEQK